MSGAENEAVEADRADFRITYTGRRSGKAAKLAAIAESYRNQGYRIENRGGYLVGWAPEPRREYGSATLHKNYDTGEVTVMQADDVIGVTPGLWNDCKPEHRPDDETLVLDTAGEYRYRLTGETGEHGRTILIFERIRESK